MFADKIGESCSTTGTGSFALGGAYNAFRTWRTGFANAEPVFYLATNDTGIIWEIGHGTLTYGTPDTISRNLIASSSGAVINWVTTPYRVYSVPVGVAMKHMLAPLINGVANVPGWLPSAAMWLDYTLGLAVAWIKKRYISGTRTAAGSHAEEGRHYLGLAGGVANIFVSSPRHYWVDKGAANYTIDADDIGKALEFNVTAANRVPTLPAGSTVGHGFVVGLIGYGSHSNGLTLTPNGSDAIDDGANGATLFVPGEQPVWVEWDGARSKWRTTRTSRKAARQILTSSGTYTTPSGAKLLQIRIWGAGGGGGGTGSAAGNGAAGGTSTFNSVGAAGGSGGAGNTSNAAASPGGGGTGGTGTADNRAKGSPGHSGSPYVTGFGAVGGNGGDTFMGPGGTGGVGGNAGEAAGTNSGGGGGGAGSNNSSYAGAGAGGAGERADLIIVGPVGTYTYTIGAAGALGTAGGSGFAGGAGAAGVIVVDEYY